MLLACIAPRPVYVHSGVEDTWADGRGEYLSAYHAGEVYRLLGKKALESEDSDLRFFAAYYLACFPSARFESEVPDPAQTYRRAVLALRTGLSDTRDFYVFQDIHGLRVSGMGSSMRSYATAWRPCATDPLGPPLGSVE